MDNPVRTVLQLLQPPPPPARTGIPQRSTSPLALQAGEELTKAQLQLQDATLGESEESERLALARAALAAQELQEQLASELDAPRRSWLRRSRSRPAGLVIDLTGRPRLPQARYGGPPAERSGQHSGQRAMPTD